MRALPPLAMVLALLVSTSGVALAQQTPPAAGPAAAACEAPPLPPGTPTPRDSGDLLPATPPASTDAASPGPIAPQATPAGTSAAAADAQAVEHLIATWAACRGAGDYEAETALYAVPALLQVGGTTNPWDTVALLEAEQEPLALQRVENIRSYPDGHFSAEITLLVGEHWLSRQFQEVLTEDGLLKIGVFSFLPTPAPDGSQVVEVRLGSEGLTVDPNIVPSGSSVDLEVRNDDQPPRGLALYLLTAGTSPAQFAAAGGNLAEAEFVAYAPAAPAAPTNMVLRDPEPGTYVLAGYIEEQGADPQLVPDLVAGFTIAGPGTPAP
jgi:hypothetical protein